MFFGAAVYIQRIFWIHEHGKVSLIFVFMNLFSGPPHHTHSSIKGVRDRSLQQARYSMHLFGQQMAPVAPYWFDNFNIMEVYLDCVGPGHSTDSGLASGTRPYSFGGPVKHRGIFKPLGIFLLW